MPFELRPEPNPTPRPEVLRSHVLVHFRFRDVVELRLEGFNHQNALFGLRIFDLRDPQWEGTWFDVRFDASHGVDASFQCRAVEVVGVTPCSKDGATISAEPTPAQDPPRD
jgi:hypothetical protein